MSSAKKSFARKVRSDEAGLWMAGRPHLARLDLELTERCNNNCIHCSVNLPPGDDGARRRESSAAEIRTVLEEAVSLGCLSVRFTGGEPLLRDDFEEIYLAARRLGLRVRLFTNATLITQRTAELLEKVPPLDPVEVSIYGMTPDTEAAVTGNLGSHQAALRAVRRLVEHGIPFVVKGAVLPQTGGEMDRLEAWARELPGRNGRPSYAMLFDLRSRRDDEAKNGRIRKLRLGPREYVRLACRRGENCAAEIRTFVGRFGGGQGDRLFSCLSDAASIDAYGRFQVCLLLRHPATVYDLRAGSLGDAVTRFLPEVREMRATNGAYLERCGRCFLKALCLQCPARSWSEHGTLDTPVEYYCAVTHAQAEEAGLLGEGEKGWAVADWRARLGGMDVAEADTGKTRAGARAKCGGE
jgi:radical SAM protein with 4Fe4S-binding SPASM domain